MPVALLPGPDSPGRAAPHRRLAPAPSAAYIPPIMIRRLATLFALLWFGSVESVQAHRTYPSLLRRPVESRDRDAELAKAAAEQQQAAPQPLAGTVAVELDRLSKQAAAGGAAFDRDLSASDRVVAAAGESAATSEPWVLAQEALSALDAGRFDSVSALAGMDSIYVEQLNAGGDAAAVAGYRTPVLSMVDRQNDLLDSLRSRLARP